MRVLLPQVGRHQRPDLIATQRGTAAAVKQRKPTSKQPKRLASNPTQGALLDQTTTPALPRDHVHLTHGTCRGALKPRHTISGRGTGPPPGLPLVAGWAAGRRSRPLWQLGRWWCTLARW